MTAVDFAGSAGAAAVRAGGRRRQGDAPGTPAQSVLSRSRRFVGSVPSTVGSAPSPARGGDDADHADDGGSCYEAPAARDAAWARRVARRLGGVVPDRWEGAAAPWAGGKGRPCRAQTAPSQRPGGCGSARWGRSRLQRRGGNGSVG